LQSKKEKGELVKYTKKEQRNFADEIEKMRENFDGLKLLIRKPDILFFVDANANETAIREARKAGVPTVGIIDTNDNPTLIDYPIFANDHSAKSVQWVINFIKEELKK
jgi:small subunit ribosomal protein S2